MKLAEKEKIRILHCIETISSGGVEQTLLTLIKGLNKEKYEHQIICTWAGGFVEQELEKEGVKIIQLGAFRRAIEIRKLVKVIQAVKAYNPHIIHGGVFEGMTMATFGGIFGRVPVVILEETSDPQNRSKKANYLLKLYSLFADMVQAISAEVGEYLIKVTKVKKNKVIVIPNGVDQPKISNRKEVQLFKEKYGIRPEEIVIGFVGRLFNDHKRVTDLIEAVSVLSLQNLKLLIVGDGKDLGQIVEKVKELELEKIVIFTGYQPDTNSFYEMMDILCIPSSREGFGLVAVEGMLHKLPIVATKVGGLQKVVKDKETGFVVPSFSPESISNKLSVLIADKELRIKMGEAGFTRAKENYSSERYCLEIEKLYLGTLEKKGKFYS
ncbi:glycosyltransferase family 4 protein [Aquiflexum sp. LQ15W]|uniref:glycosyltransferase family 4 protein n=1 Tax=Cognataquiflexum nitidum TaxID=2922272 RepID=UPI001F14021B|nr:glycosyltransferase family 4 protein [Cognataquiflexum nitidum]MCH6202098.1 glycosyltransferase family 4 protein [Cognataquiflexum nitidum]